MSILFLVTKSGKVHTVRGDLHEVARLVESSTRRLEQFKAHEPEGAIVYISPESVESIREA